MKTADDVKLVCVRVEVGSLWQTGALVGRVSVVEFQVSVRFCKLVNHVALCVLA